MTIATSFMQEISQPNHIRAPYDDLATSRLPTVRQNECTILYPIQPLNKCVETDLICLSFASFRVFVLTTAAAAIRDCHQGAFTNPQRGV